MDERDDEAVILKDGSTVHLRPARGADLPLLEAFLAAMGRAAELAGAAREVDPARALTLLALRTRGGAARLVGAAVYVQAGPGLATAHLGVEPGFRGQGLATRLVERLAMAAALHGIRRLRIPDAAANAALLDVLRHAGFALAASGAGEAVEIDLAAAPDAGSRSHAELRDRLATAASIRPFFHPRAVAVVGASREAGSLGYRTLTALVANRFEGPVYAVNPHARHVGPFPAYRSVRDLPAGVDLAVLLVPKARVLEAVDECAAAGVRALVVITAGFAETGPGGRALQDELLARVRGHGMRLVGPNCMGLLNADPAVRLNASFAPVFPPPGNVAMSSQSGALGLAVLATAQDLGIGMSSFVSVGNKADVSGNDLLQYWEDDERTAVVLLYVESFGNPRRFARIARRLGRRKPIVAVKSGRTGAGKRAAGSHTAALAGSDAAVDALFHQTGVIRAATLEEMFDLALVLSSQPLPRGPRVAILTNAGGPAILCADACEANGLTIPPLSDAVRAGLARLLPPEGSTHNPVDMIASAGPALYREATRLLLEAPEVDALVVIYAPIEAADLAPVEEAIHAAVAAGPGRKPVLACLMGEGGRGAPRQLRRGIPCYVFPEAAARVLGKVEAYARWRRAPPGVAAAPADLGAARAFVRERRAAGGPGWLGMADTARLLELAGLPGLPGALAADADEAVRLAAGLGRPVALKLASRLLVHKTDVGGVELGLTGEPAVRAAHARLLERARAAGALAGLDGVWVQPMLAGGVEVMAGMTEDPVFGPVVAFGLGGIHVEVLGDVVFRVTPLTVQDAAEMVRGIRGRRLLEGYRGDRPADLKALEAVLLRISQLVDDIPEIDDLDLNPLLALPPGEGCRLIDARVRLR